MRQIAKNNELIEALSGELTLLDGRLTRLDIFEDPVLGLVIDVYIVLLRTREPIQLRFTEIAEYGFYYSKELSFYFIERYKFISSGDDYYLSLDPSDDLEVVNIADQDFIRSKVVEGFYL